MKQALLSTFLLFTLHSFGQSFATFEAAYYATKLSTKAIGLDFTGGAFLKNSEDKGNRSFQVGAGLGMIIINNDAHDQNFYAPIYAQAGYYNYSKKITPYINARVGYGIYKGSGLFIGKNELTKGGLYANVRGGAGFAVNKKFGVLPFAGCSLIMLRKVIAGETIEQYNAGLFNAGIALFFKGK